MQKTAIHFYNGEYYFYRTEELPPTISAPPWQNPKRKSIIVKGFKTYKAAQFAALMLGIDTYDEPARGDGGADA